jgi:soluble lytic murein transglycosylase-like protein
MIGQTSTDIAGMIASTATTYGVDPSLALEVAIQESGLNQNAVGSAGEIGVFQLLPLTAAALGVDPTNLAQNIQGGCMLLAQLYAEFGGDTTKILAAYNWGSGNVSSAISNYGSNWLSYAPSSTQAYISSIEGNLGTQYTASAGAAPGAIPTGTVSEAGVGVGTGLSFGTIALILGLALIGMMLLAE